MKTDAIRECVGLVADAAGRDGPAVAAESELEAIERSDPQTLVTEFHRKMGLPVASEPTVGTPEQRVLRFRLMLEEVLEWGRAANLYVWSESGDEVDSVRNLTIEQGTNAPDLLQMTHELADVQYVVSGTAVELGLPVREALPLIHEANMRKEPVLDSGGKVRKPEGWVPADVSGLLKK
jgi:predicted HAD superfamily Cof-like phosphohydrolase